jgi:hypothetical protein
MGEGGLACQIGHRVTAHQPRPPKGIAVIVLATLAFAASDVLGRLVMMHPVVPVVMAVRYLVNMVLLAVFYTRRWERVSGRSSGEIYASGVAIANGTGQAEATPPAALHPARQHEDQHDDQNNADHADAAMAITVAVAAKTAAETAQQKDHQQDE